MAAVAAICHMTACVANLSNIKQRRNKTKQPFAFAPVSAPLRATSLVALTRGYDVGTPPSQVRFCQVAVLPAGSLGVSVQVGSQSVAFVATV